MKDRRPTSFDIAYQAGVSQSTVSRALRNSPQVSQATRDRVQAIARELNYRVDKHATALRSQSSDTLALLIFEDETADDSHINPFFMSMLANITRATSDRGYDLLVSFQRLDEDWHLEYELSSRADGLILLGYGDYTLYRERLERMASVGAHTILWGPGIPDAPVTTLGTDNRLGGRLSTEHLLGLGHRRFVFIGNIGAGSPEFQQRYEGHREALSAAGIDPSEQRQLDCGNTETEAKAVAETLLSTCRDCSAIVCASDLIAISIMRQLRAAGIDVPRDISIVGFDDLPQAGWTEPALTTIRQDTHRSSELLVANLIAQIRGETVNNEQVTPSLVVRASTASSKS